MDEFPLKVADAVPNSAKEIEVISIDDAEEVLPSADNAAVGANEKAAPEDITDNEENTKQEDKTPPMDESSTAVAENEPDLHISAITNGQQHAAETASNVPTENGKTESRPAMHVTGLKDILQASSDFIIFRICGDGSEFPDLLCIIN